jgi:streptogramin lyase
MIRLGTTLAATLVILGAISSAQAEQEMRTFPVLAGAGAHDVYPAPDGSVVNAHRINPGLMLELAAVNWAQCSN